MSTPEFVNSQGLKDHFGISLSKVRRNELIRSGRFPRPHYVTPKLPLWRYEDVRLLEAAAPKTEADTAA